MIKSFLETAANPRFRQNLYHATLFKYHVLGDRTVPDPGLPPYYPASFFRIIKKVAEETPLNIITMSLKQWYALLLEEDITMRRNEGNLEFIPCRAELRSPGTDWECVWRRIRLPGLDSELTSFLFRLLHDLLPTKERQNRISAATPSTCRHCQDNTEEDLLHAMFLCEYNRDVSHALVQAILAYDNTITPRRLLTLEYDVADDDLELPITWVTAETLKQIWNSRLSGKRVRLYTIRAEIESKVAMMRKTRHYNSSQKILDIIRTWPEGLL